MHIALRKYSYEIDKCISLVRPPNEIRRTPRSVDAWSFFKANEYKAWLLFYSLLILSLFLPPKYVHHLALLVTSMHILLSDKILKNDLSDAHYIMLYCFYNDASQLYERSIYTNNMHSLIHIVPMVELWGPLWGYSMFSFENVNGYLG